MKPQLPIVGYVVVYRNGVILDSMGPWNERPISVFRTPPDASKHPGGTVIPVTVTEYTVTWNTDVGGE